MLKRLLLIFSSIILSATLKAQSTALDYKLLDDTTAIFYLKMKNSVGPLGNLSIGAANLNQIGNKEKLCIPKITNTPSNWRDITSYYYIYNHPQFIFQNYLDGIYDKKELMEEFSKSGRKLSDTTFFARKKLRCGFHIVLGHDENGLPKVIADENNNLDFSDDAPFNLLERQNSLGSLASNENRKVLIDFFEDQAIHTSPVAYKVINDTKDSILRCVFSFPNYYYLKVADGNQSYIFTTQYSSNSNFAFYLLENRPYFTSPSANQRLRIGNSFSIGDTLVRLKEISPDGQKVTITGKKPLLFLKQK